MIYVHVHEIGDLSFNYAYIIFQVLHNAAYCEVVWELKIIIIQESIIYYILVFMSSLQYKLTTSRCLRRAVYVMERAQ